jgi:quercetin dioxygenase-like cupin family protein
LNHKSDFGETDSLYDGRSKTVLVDEGLLPDAGDLLVDMVEYGRGVSCPVHYDKGIDHFFFILEGGGVLEIEGEDIELSQGSVAWFGEGDRHRLFAGENESIQVFESFSNGACWSISREMASGNDISGHFCP